MTDTNDDGQYWEIQVTVLVPRADYPDDIGAVDAVGERLAGWSWVAQMPMMGRDE